MTRQFVARDEWPAERTERLRALWDEGLSVNEIARALDVSRNAVAAKRRRIKLPGRASPILPKPLVTRLPIIPPGAKITLPPLPSLMMEIEK